MNTENYLKVKRLIENADAIIIGAGAGLSTAAGINYGKKGFAEKYPELVKKYGFTDMYSSSFYPFKTEEERWSYWAKHIEDLCIGRGATATYQKLYQLVQEKNYFVITTNVDQQFEKSGFLQEKIFEVQGSLTKIQCARGCHNKLYDDTCMVREMLKEDEDGKVPTSLVPYCPKCGGTMEVNLRKDNFFVEDEHWHNQERKYEQFIRDNQEKKLLFLEFGVGFNTPGIIRYPFEELTSQFPYSNLVRVNQDFADISKKIHDKAYGFSENINVFLDKISSKSL